MCVQPSDMAAVMCVWCVDGYAVYTNVHMRDIDNNIEKLLAGHYATFGEACMWNQMQCLLVPLCIAMEDLGSGTFFFLSGAALSSTQPGSHMLALCLEYLVSSRSLGCLRFHLLTATGQGTLVVIICCKLSA